MIITDKCEHGVCCCTPKSHYITNCVHMPKNTIASNVQDMHEVEVITIVPLS